MKESFLKTGKPTLPIVPCEISDFFQRTALKNTKRQLLVFFL